MKMFLFLFCLSGSTFQDISQFPMPSPARPSSVDLQLAKIKKEQVNNRQTDRQTERQIHRQTDRQTDIQADI